MAISAVGSRFEDELRSGPNDFELVDDNNELDDVGFTKTAHVMFYALSNFPVLKCYNTRAAIHMNVRFDGHFGFPGGISESWETPEDAVNREFVEEYGSAKKEFTLGIDDLSFVHQSPSRKVLAYFYVKKISLLQLVHLEKSYVAHGSWGDEIFGSTRVPLFTMSDGVGGLPTFLSSPFVGNSRQQLIQALRKLRIVTDDELEKALKRRPLRVGDGARSS